MNKCIISFILLLPVLQTAQAYSNSDITQQIQNLLTQLNSLQNQALQKNIPEQEFLQKIKAIKDQLNILQAQSNTPNNEKKSDTKEQKNSSSSNKVSDIAVKQAHYGSQITNPDSKKTTVKIQSMENGKDDFNPDNQNNQETTPLHVAEQENEKDANSDPEKNTHQSFFLGEGMVSVQALSQTVDAFDARNNKDKKIGSYKRSLNYVQGYSLGTLTIGKKTIQVLEDNSSTRTPILAVIQKGLSKKPAAYIKNSGYNKMVQKSPAIIHLYAYTA